MKFTKMHGLGNDYVYVDGFKEQVDDPVAVARLVADRHFGVGGDGMILILPSERGDVRMRMFNSNGEEGEMCGNGVRCVAKYAYDHGLSKNNPIRVETGRGVLPIALDVDENDRVSVATVDMDEPILDLREIGINQGAIGRQPLYTRRGEHEFAIAHEIDRKELHAVFVSMGNPHMVHFVEDVDAIDLEKHGPKLEHYPAWPRKTNVHFAQVIAPGELKMRTWERGSGITLACGTGASAVLVAGVLTKRCAREALVHLPGGDLNIRWDEKTNHVFMTGPATEVFSGEISLEGAYV
jgi:diaminopimelate epimerase